ncbi:hypothetical protein E2C01_088338 [Portunus trituberculatus]|uniref:Uncharacterized protein n=1 Tax=Portunus trituberculatus TaxID=210409 RepID=A0A5B7JF45_PORTR|nr:hypothetical protein [Portunus trituberculatus]
MAGVAGVRCVGLAVSGQATVHPVLEGSVRGHRTVRSREKVHAIAKSRQGNEI